MVRLLSKSNTCSFCIHNCGYFYFTQILSWLFSFSETHLSPRSFRRMMIFYFLNLNYVWNIFFPPFHFFYVFLSLNFKWASFLWW
jgi:hypothetical protein